MKILYCRTSSLEQKTDRQRVNENDFDNVVEDKCSGVIPFFEREGGKEIMKLIDNEVSFKMYVHSICRMGRDLRGIINTIHFFNEKQIPIQFITQGITTLDDNGKENSIAKLMISILGTVSEMHRTQIKEAQMEGIRIAKMKGNVYNGRKKDTKEDVLRFLGKEKNRKSIELLKKGYKAVEISKIVGIHINTITKIKKYINQPVLS